MEKHKCKLCLRNFPNGRALGGHMRSHMVNLKPEEPPPPPPLVQLSFEADESSPSSFSSGEEDDDDDDKALSYGLRENPKRSFRLVDPEFSFPIESNSVILQDRESETESSMNPTRTGSKRAFTNNNIQFHRHHQKKKMKSSNDFHHHHRHHHHHKNKTESSCIQAEPVSSISDGTTDEDVAFWLIMLSRDQWKRQEEEDEDEEEEEEEEDEEDERSVEDSDEFYEEMKSSKTKSVRGGRYKCETCNKVFRSYQALGGHRASHKKMKAASTYEPEIDNATAVAEKKIHECPVCLRVFASGQALGGHKRTHVTGSSATSSVVRSSNTPLTTIKMEDNNNKNNSLIDLNLPAPVDDDEISQIENSAVSDAEFLKPSSQFIEARV